MEEQKPDQTTPAEPSVIPPQQPQVQPKKSKKPIIIVVAVLALFAIAGAVYYFLSQEDSDTPAVTSQQTVEEPAAHKKASKISVKEEGKLVLPNGYADPTIAKTDSGYRMYVNQQSGGPSGYVTFTSSDGVTWTKENGVVIPGVSTGRAFKMNDGVRVYYPGTQPIKPSDPQANMLSSFASDGLTFAKDSGNRLEPQSAGHYVEGPTVFQLEDNSWRMYFNENTVAAGNQRDGIIWGADSADGLAFSRDSKPTIEYEDSIEGASKQPWPQVLHPFVIKNPKGGYVMFYNSHSEIFAASSEDGKTWEKLGKIGVHGADADGYFQEDGTFRLYYGDFSEQTGGLVYSAVLTIE